MCRWQSTPLTVRPDRETWLAHLCSLRRYYGRSRMSDYCAQTLLALIHDSPALCPDISAMGRLRATTLIKPARPFTDVTLTVFTAADHFTGPASLQLDAHASSSVLPFACASRQGLRRGLIRTHLAALVADVRQYTVHCACSFTGRRC
jgi:hypothetical protein